MQFAFLLKYLKFTDFASSYAILIGFEFQNRSKYRLRRAAHCWSAKNSTSGFKQALNIRKQLLWWSLTKDFHENDKVEKHIQQFRISSSLSKKKEAIIMQVGKQTAGWKKMTICLDARLT